MVETFKTTMVLIDINARVLEIFKNQFHHKLWCYDALFLKHVYVKLTHWLLLALLYNLKVNTWSVKRKKLKIPRNSREPFRNNRPRSPSRKGSSDCSRTPEQRSISYDYNINKILQCLQRHLDLQKIDMPCYRVYIRRLSPPNLPS